MFVARPCNDFDHYLSVSEASSPTSLKVDIGSQEQAVTDWGRFQANALEGA